MFRVNFPDEDAPECFYNNICYIAYRHNSAFDSIDSKFMSKKVLNQLWIDQSAIKVGASNDFYRFIRKMKGYTTYTSNGNFYCIGIGILPGSGLNHYKVEQLLHFQLIEDRESGEWFKRQIRSRLISILQNLGLIIIFKGVYRTQTKKPT